MRCHSSPVNEAPMKEALHEPFSEFVPASLVSGSLRFKYRTQPYGLSRAEAVQAYESRGYG